MDKEETVPSPVYPPPHLTPEQVLAARAAEDERIDLRADERIGIHWSKCPAVRMRLMMLGMWAVLVLVFGSLVLGVSSWINTKLEAQNQRIEAALITHKAHVREDVRQVVRDELSYSASTLQKLIARGAQ